MIPLYETDGRSTTALGVPVCQNRLAVPTWDYAIEHYRPARIIELGTYTGGLSLALGVHAWMIGAAVVTYDRMSPNEQIAPLAKLLGIEYRTCDLYAPDTQADIARRICDPGVTYLLCDGGDKNRELALFMPHLKPGDVIAAHDYDVYGDPGRPDRFNALEMDKRPWPWCETNAVAARLLAEQHRLVPWMQDFFDDAGWLVFQRPV
jgi:cephalosporin hydroxylase